ncbi:MAG: trigger factor [Lachnospiraceae bacterium]|nr:MAG: trigger factor [Lachnospiraceae bacterium]
MKKRIYLMTAISAVAIALTACGGNAGNNKSTGGSTATGSAVSSDTTGAATGASIEFNPADYIEKLADYKGLEYTKQDVSVTDAEVDEKVKSFLEAYPEKITDRAVKKGDNVNIDFEGKKDGVAFDGGTAKGFNLKIGSNSFIPGFEDGLIGKKPGETVDLNLKFPDDYKNSEELKGAKVVFTVKINYIVGETPTELTDELVKANTEFKTAAEYKADIRKKLETIKSAEEKENVQKELLEKVVTASSIKSVPEVAEDKYYGQIMDYWKNVAAKYGMELKDLVQNQLKLTEEKFEEEVKKQAELSARILVVVRAIAEAEKINVSDEEYKTALNTYYENSGANAAMDLDAYEKQVGKGNVMDIVLNDKVGAFLVENGKAVNK